MIDEAIIAKTIAYYGADNQSTVCMEECAELIQAISKEKRGKSNKTHLAEEMADVAICLEMLKKIYNVPEELVNRWITAKMKRQVRRMRGE